MTMFRLTVPCIKLQLFIITPLKKIERINEPQGNLAVRLSQFP